MFSVCWLPLRVILLRSSMNPRGRLRGRGLSYVTAAEEGLSGRPRLVTFRHRQARGKFLCPDGFRKVVHIEQGGLLKPERDDTEFQHPFFIRGEEHLLENIKRKVTNVSSLRQDEVKISTEEVNKILSDVQLMKGKQETIDSRISAMKHENEALWREVASLRQKHTQQQKVVNKLIQFLVSLIQTNRILGVKRKIPLMLNDSSSAHSLPKYSRQFSLEHLQAAASLFSADSPITSGPIISDITEVTSPIVEGVANDWMDAGESQSVNIKDDTPSPDVGTHVDTPLSPTTFINSILQDNETQPTANLTPAIVEMSSTSSGPLPPTPTNQSSASFCSLISGPSPTQQKCQTIACIDRPPPPPRPSAGGFSPDLWHLVSSSSANKSELSDHVDTMDNSLENLQNILNTQTFTFDNLPLLEFFGSSSSSGEFDLDSLDNLLSEEAPKDGGGSSSTSDTGKQLVQYTATPPLTSEGEADLPSLLELEAEPFLGPGPPTNDPTATLLSHAHHPSDL